MIFVLFMLPGQRPCALETGQDIQIWYFVHHRAPENLVDKIPVGTTSLWQHPDCSEATVYSSGSMDEKEYQVVLLFGFVKYIVDIYRYNLSNQPMP
jgi:hypothetical protein